MSGMNYNRRQRLAMWVHRILFGGMLAFLLVAIALDLLFGFDIRTLWGGP